MGHHLACCEVGQQVRDLTPEIPAHGLQEDVIRGGRAERTLPDQLRQRDAGEVRGKGVGHAARDGVRHRRAADTVGARNCRDATLRGSDDLIGVGLGVVERKRRDGMDEIGLLGQPVHAAADRRGHLDRRVECGTFLAQILQRLAGVLGHRHELADLTVQGRVRHVLDHQAHAVHVRQRVGHPRDGGEVVEGTVPQLAGLEVEDPDAGHARAEYGVPLLHLVKVGAVPIPDLGALRQGLEALLHEIGLEADDVIRRDVAAGVREEVQHPGIRIEGHAGLAQQLEDRVDDLLDVGLRQQLVDRGSARRNLLVSHGSSLLTSCEG